MKNRLLIFLLITIFLASCSKDEEVLLLEPDLSEYEKNVIDYFKDIALGFEFGNASEITRKWNSEMKIFVGGTPSSELINELENIRTELNGLVSDGFKMSIVNDSLQSNYYIYFGSGISYAELFPNLSDLINSNWGLFSVYWNGQSQLTSGRMYVDIARANLTEQKHLLREELTQSLGLAKDSPKYQESIFQSAWTTTTEYAAIDKELIRLLYHPQMNSGLNDNQVDFILREILKSE